MARRANVSVKTVSNVANGYANVSEGTRVRVQQAIDDLGYRPDPIAQALRRQCCDVVTLIIPDSATEQPSAVRQLVELAASLGFCIDRHQSEIDDSTNCVLVVTDHSVRSQPPSVPAQTAPPAHLRPGPNL